MAVIKRNRKTSPRTPSADPSPDRAGRRDLRHEIVLMRERIHAVSTTTSCVTFVLQRDRLGDLVFVDVGDSCWKLLQRKQEAVKESFAYFLDAIDPAERLGLEAAIVASATRHAPLSWEGRLRARGRQKPKWIRMRAPAPRTDTAAARWQGVMTDISRERELDIALKRSREQLSELSSYLEAGKEEERERIARDIHDELGSILVAIKIEVALLTGKLPDQLAVLRSKARSIESLLDQAMGTASRVARELRPGILKEFGLPAAIECQAEDFSQRTGITCRAQCDDDGLDVEERCALAVFRIVQEALTNVAKHAHASLVALRLRREGQHIVLEIRDNGRGISDADVHKPKSFGLRGISERARSLNGELHIGAGEQGGTHIMLRLPMRSSARRAAAEDNVQRKLF